MTKKTMFIQASLLASMGALPLVAQQDVVPSSGAGEMNIPASLPPRDVGILPPAPGSPVTVPAAPTAGVPAVTAPATMAPSEQPAPEASEANPQEQAAPVAPAAPATSAAPQEQSPAPTAPAPSTTGSASGWQPRPTEVSGGGEITTIKEQEGRGNWFFKAKTLKKARKQFEEIRHAVSRVMPSNEEFSRKLAEFETLINQFYQELGFQAGEIDERLKNLSDQLKQIETSPQGLTPEQKVLQKDIQEKLAELEKVKANLTLLQKMDSALHEAVASLDRQLGRINAYQDQAWKNYEKIEDTLSDEIADELYRGMENQLQNIVAIERYIANELSAFYSKTQADAQQQMTIIREGVTRLKERGVALGKALKEQLASEEKRKADEAARKEKARQKANRPWYAGAVETVSGWFAAVWLWLKSLGLWFCRLIKIC